MNFNCNCFNKKVSEVLRRHIKSPVGCPRWNFLQNQLTGLNCWQFFGKGALQDFWQGSENNSGYTNFFLSFLSLGMSHMSFCRYLLVEACHVERSQLTCRANQLTGFYMVQVFAGGIFEQTTVKFYSQEQRQKASFYFYTCPVLILVDCTLSACSCT